jgi:hypothetical protein
VLKDMSHSLLGIILSQAANLQREKTAAAAAAAATEVAGGGGSTASPPSRWLQQTLAHMPALSPSAVV